MSKPFSWEAFYSVPVIGILRNIPPHQTDKVVEQYYRAGFTTLEITMNSLNAAQTISSIAKSYEGKLNVGAGTVCNVSDLEEALSAGAQFVVTPILDEEVVKICVTKKVPVFPGAYTPTEIYKAWSLGADMVKIFPATKLGPDFIKEILGPLNQLKLVPTGGVSVDNFTDFLTAGAKGLGIGSNLFPKHFIENEQWEELYRFFTDFIKKYNQFKLNNQ